MRVLLSLRSLKDQVYDNHYHHKLQGLIYKLLKNKFPKLHDKKGYKFFCFSNIFPIKDFKEDDERKLLISSPSHLFIEHISEEFKKMEKEKRSLNIGDLQFSIEDVSVLNPKIKDRAIIASSTPIVIRIPERNYDRYSIPQSRRKKNYLYWRPEYPFEAFIKQLEENIFKKWKQFYNKEIKEFPLFQQFKFKKTVVNHIIKNWSPQMVIGSVWEFRFDYMDEYQKKLLKFGLDSGFGERNSLGFGFMNVVK